MNVIYNTDQVIGFFKDFQLSVCPSAILNHVVYIVQGIPAAQVIHNIIDKIKEFVKQ